MNVMKSHITVIRTDYGTEHLVYGQGHHYVNIISTPIDPSLSYIDNINRFNKNKTKFPQEIVDHSLIIFMDEDTRDDHNVEAQRKRVLEDRRYTRLERGEYMIGVNMRRRCAQVPFEERSWNRLLNLCCR